MKLFTLVLIALSLELSAQYNITGTVSSAESGEPMVNAVVGIEGSYFQSLTTMLGEYKIAGLDQGRYTLIVNYLGHEEYRQEVDVFANTVVHVRLDKEIIMQPAVTVTATRAGERTPMSYSELDREAIEASNTGKDIPYLLNQLPSTVATSDAGTGVGYTSLRIRGSDITRINVTVNGIPLNDAESHGVWWVDLPDMASSTESIQVQRGVGTSTLGAGAFGATINLQTNSFNRDPYGDVSLSYGSFNTSKVTARLGTGLVKNRWMFDGRLSRLHSDGFIDRATADLMSWFISGSYYGRRSLLTANVFSGHEVTYQAWYGVPQDSFESNPTYNPVTYENEVDDYHQTHYQLLWSADLGKGFYLNASGHYTRGMGYFEQYRVNEPFADYGFTPIINGTDTINTTDLIRRRWLDNDFYGVITSLRFDPGQKLKAILGGGWNTYLGRHFGEVIWARFGSDSIGQRYYDNDATKTDFNAFAKITYQAAKGVQLFADMQLRQVTYSFLGFTDSMVPATQTVSHSFLNPKAGVTIDVGSAGMVYTSFGMANREPTRDDYIASTPSSRPRPEALMDIELGYRLRLKKIAVTVNGFYMSYTDQLVLTGQINDVGAYTRSNVSKSYRAGGELEWLVDIVKGLTWTGNFTYSMNRIPAFTEYIDNYDSGGQDSVLHENTDIAFSPAIIVGSDIAYSPLTGLTVNLITKYVGSQFLDNTSNPDRMLDPFLVNDLRVNYEFKGWKGIDRFSVMAAVYNLFNQVYAPNGYTFSYVSGAQTITQNYLYPQAGMHFVVGGGVRF